MIRACRQWQWRMQQPTQRAEAGWHWVWVPGVERGREGCAAAQCVGCCVAHSSYPPELDVAAVVRLQKGEKAQQGIEACVRTASTCETTYTSVGISVEDNAATTNVLPPNPHSQADSGRFPMPHDTASGLLWEPQATDDLLALHTHTPVTSA